MLLLKGSTTAGVTRGMVCSVMYSSRYTGSKRAFAAIGLVLCLLLPAGWSDSLMHIVQVKPVQM